MTDTSLSLSQCVVRGGASCFCSVLAKTHAMAPIVQTQHSNFKILTHNKQSISISTVAVVVVVVVLFLLCKKKKKRPGHCVNVVTVTQAFFKRKKERKTWTFGLCYINVVIVFSFKFQKN